MRVLRYEYEGIRARYYRHKPVDVGHVIQYLLVVNPSSTAVSNSNSDANADVCGRIKDLRALGVDNGSTLVRFVFSHRSKANKRQPLELVHGCHQDGLESISSTYSHVVF